MPAPRPMYFVLVLILASGCASLPDNVEKSASAAFSGGPQTSVGSLFATEVRAHPGQSGIQVIDTGKDALQLRLSLLTMAERAIDLQYYIWNSDFSGRVMAERVLQAADRGVRVRLLLDDFSVGDRDAPLMAMDAHPNIEVRIYNPNAYRKGLGKWLALIGDFGRLNQRMHNKSFIVDGSLAIVGGRNIGDEYFDLDDELNFRDRELLVAGPVVAEVARGFDTYWNSERSFPVSAISSKQPDPPEVQALRSRLQAYIRDHPRPDYPLPANRDSSVAMLQHWNSKLIWAQAEAVFDRVPELAQTDSAQRKRVARKLAELARQATSEVLIESAYLVLGDEGASILSDRTTQGVPVRALTNSLASNDVIPNHAGYARRRKQMLQNGMELYEFRPDAVSCRQLLGTPSRCDEQRAFSLHAKSIVFDRSRVFVGSFNLNLRSVYLNAENGLIVHSPALARRVAADIEENMRSENSWRVKLNERSKPVWIGRENGVEVRYTKEPATGFWRRFKSGLISRLPIEKYL